MLLVLFLLHFLLMCICYCIPYLRLVNVEFQLELLIPALHMCRITFKYFGVLC